MFKKIIKKNYFKLFSIIITSLIIDNLLVTQINNPPAWDQGYHISNVFKIYNIFEYDNLNIFEKTKQILNVTDSYRGPLTYFISALFLKFFSNTYHFAYLSNQIFNIICIISIFHIGKLFKNESIGIWASLIFSFSQFIIIQRSDFLIDLSLTSFCTLSFLFLTKWYLSDPCTENVKYALLSGSTLGLVFLVKPTGIIFFLFPLLLVIIKLIRNKKSNIISNTLKVSLFILSFLLIIFPWFSKHWLTIISSILNAWNWGIKYQDGLDANSIEGWFFYFKNIPSIFGVINSSIFFIVFLIALFFKKQQPIFKINKLKKLDLWFFLYLLNSYLIISLMSTKDIRFILPVYPIICIYLGKVITQNIDGFFNPKFKKYILLISLSISIFFSGELLIFNKIENKALNNYKWPHEEIINTIKKENPNLISTLAVIPDTKEVNTFNLEAEASRQGEYVAVRQIVSNKETYKEDLEYFDWFLLKSDDQGVMNNESKNLLHQYLLDNSSFNVFKEWKLPDRSNLYLLRRNSINTLLTKYPCIKRDQKLNIKQINNGINLSFTEKGETIKSKNLLIDFIGQGYKSYVNLSLANNLFHPNFKGDLCYKISQDIPIDFPLNIKKEKISFKVRSLNKSGNIKNLNVLNSNFTIEENFIKSNQILMNNRISKVKLLGNYLRKGEFKNLFDLVGIINQSDPKQIYLKESEKIFKQRYKENNNLEDLYSILISQILQKKISESENTINLILKSDHKNGNAYLIKAIINVYLLDRNDARLSLNSSKVNQKSSESNEILSIVEALTYLLEFKFKNAYNIFI